ncbi:MAG TPA: glucose-6-phosphate isomerase, partial [Acholeplasmataceae bacterium]|nr:glucose-6-phosphate isomerase [Acholeplasmataceae bacterium]
MAHIQLTVNDARSFLDVKPESLQNKVNELHQMIHEKTGKGNDYLGWLDLPIHYDKAEYARILASAKRIQEQSKILVVIGIG